MINTSRKTLRLAMFALLYLCSSFSLLAGLELRTFVEKPIHESAVPCIDNSVLMGSVTADDSEESINEDADPLIINLFSLISDSDEGDWACDDFAITFDSFPATGMISYDEDNCELTYDPDEDYFGTFDIVYHVEALEDEDMATGTITVEVVSVNDIPTALNYAPASFCEDVASPIDISPGANISDVETDEADLEINILPGPDNGDIVVSGTTVTFEPNADFYGDFDINYTVSDEDGGTSPSATISISVLPVNDVPTANDMVVLTDDIFDDSVEVTLDLGTALNVQDTEGDDVEISIVSAAIPGISWTTSGADLMITADFGALGTFEIELEFCNDEALVDHDESCGAVDLCSDTYTITFDVDPGDNDQDGIPNDIEGDDDFDEDTIANYLDVDSDNDDIEDGDEDLDFDGVWDCEDGETNWLDADTDGDGIEDGLETTTDPLDIDSDDDGLADGPGENDEYLAVCEDCNGDGDVDAGETFPNDPDSDDDCLLDGVEVGLMSIISSDGCIGGTDESMTYTCATCCGGNETGLPFQLDADGNTTTDPLNADTDNDTYLDGHEDAGLDGLFDTDNVPDPFLTLASSCYEQDCVGTSCFGGFDSDPNSVCSPDCWDHDECDCDAQADSSQDPTPNGANYCKDLWNALCGIPDLDNQALLDYVTIGDCDEFTIDGSLPSISSILDNNSINDPGLNDDGDNIPQSCDNCNPGYYLAYNSSDPCPSGSYIGSGASANAFQSDDDGDGIGNLCDDCPSDEGGLKGCKDEDACNYNPFAACEGEGECEYSFPSTSGSFDDVIYACASDMDFDLIAAIQAEYGFGPLPQWGDNQVFTVLIDGSSYDWEDLESLDIADIGQNWCDGVDVSISVTHADLDPIFCTYDDVFETVSCDVCGVLSSLDFDLVVNYQAQGESTGQTACFGVEALDTPIPNPFSSFAECNVMDDYDWTWTVASGDGGIGASNDLITPLFTLGGGLDVGDNVVFNIESEIDGCPSVNYDFTVTISNSSDLEFSLEDELTPVSQVDICENASEQEFHFEILSIGGGTWDPDVASLQQWSSTGTPEVTAIGGGVYSVDIIDLFAEGNDNQVILLLAADIGCPDNSDTINFVLTEAPELDFVSADLIGDSLLVLCETAEDRAFELAWDGPVTWDIVDSQLNENLSFSITPGANSSAIEVDVPSIPGSYLIASSTDISQVPYGCSNVSDSFELLITNSPEITEEWAGLNDSFYCSPGVLEFQIDYYNADPNGIWSPLDQDISVSNFDANYVTPSPAGDVEAINFDSSADDFMPLQEDILVTISVDDGTSLRSCQAVTESIVVHSGASPIVDSLQVIMESSPFDGIELTGVELDSDALCQGSDLTLQAHPDLQVIGDETTQTTDEFGTWQFENGDETTGGTILQVDDVFAADLDVEMTYSWIYTIENVDHTCTSTPAVESWSVEADSSCTGCPIFELPGPAFVACASDLAINSNDEGAYIRWGYFDENGMIGGFFDDGLEQQSIFYPTLDEIEMYGDDVNRLFAFVSAYEDLHCGCLSLGENTVFTDVEELILEGIEIFPNPSNGFFNVSLPDELLFVPLKFQVFDSMGRAVVEDLDCSLGTCGLDLRNQADGVYIVRITSSSSGAAYKKFIVKQ